MKRYHFVLIAGLLTLVAGAAESIKVTGDIYRKGDEWLISADLSDSAIRKSQYRLLDLSLGKNFTKDRIYGQVEALPVDCPGAMPCLRVKNFIPVLYDPLSTK